MPRVRISTTVDEDLLDEARLRRSPGTDAELIDAALSALIGIDRATEIDAAYQAAYTDQPIDQADEWGDLASFRAAVAR